MKSTVSRDSLDTAKKAAYRILSYRDHSSYELTQKLLKKGFSKTHVSQTLEFLKRINLLDDQKFARAWSRFRIEQSHYGPVRLRAELLKKGLSPNVVDPLLCDLSEEYEATRQIETALFRRYKNVSDLREEKDRRRAFDYLRRKGHETHAILSVFRKIKTMSSRDPV